MAKAPSVWSCMSKMAPEHFKHLYVDFPQKVRLHLGDWLENQPWEYITGTDAFCVETANSILNNLVEELKRAARNCDTPFIFQFVENFMSMSQCDPMALVLLFKTICKGEMEIVLKQYPRLAVSFQARQEEIMFNYRIKKLQHKIKEATVTQQRLNEMMVNGKFSGQVQDLQKQWIILIDESLKLLKSVQDQAIKIISIWKRRQQLAGNGAPFDENLLPLQDRLEIIFGIYEELIRMIREFNGTGQRILPQEFLDHISVGFSALINSSFLVDKQPPQVLKTQTKFQASVNFMLGSKILTGVSKMPIIRANIITEKKAQELFVTPSTEGLNDGAGEIENGISVFEFNQATRSCGTVFKNMLLKKIKRCERKGSESVTEEKCAILFTAEINFSGSTYIIQDFSLPLVVIVHGNQDNNAKATILWDNAFSEIARRPFYVEEKVPWKKMCQALNMKFMSEVGTKQELTPLHFRSLAQKIFGENVNYEDTKDCMVSWAQFNKEPLRERNFTFWQWFDGVMDLTKKHLKDYWSDGLILGFISKQYVHNFLGGKPSGTFLLRFSDSGIGGITIAHIVPGEDGLGQIQNIQPFHANELKIRCLGDCVRDLKQLTYLYEKGEKDTVFDKYYKKVVDSKNGYTRAQIVVTVDGDGSQQNPSQINSLPIDEEESFQMHRSPVYGSPVVSPVMHTPSTGVLYNHPAISPSLIQPLQPTLQEHNPFFVDQRHVGSPLPPQYYPENNTSGCMPFYHNVLDFNQMETCNNGTFQIEDVLDVLNSDANQSSYPMEESNTWNNSDSAKGWL